MSDATLVASRERGALHVALGGDWTLSRLLPQWPRLERELAGYAQVPEAEWDLAAVERLDDVSAAFLLRAWGGRVPSSAKVKPEHLPRFAALAESPELHEAPHRPGDFFVRLGEGVFAIASHASALTLMLGSLVLDAGHLARHPSRIPWREFSANIHRTGGQAMPITALIGFLVGVVLSFLSSLLLRQYGADLFVINVVGIGMTRELSPLLAALLVAGRSGSSMTAQLGVMRVTQELDALSVMGISHTLRLVLPKVLALMLTMPLIVAWTDAAGILGGALVSEQQLGIRFRQFLIALPDAVPLVNLWIGLGKAAVFGAVIALVACHFGLRIKPNTESLGANTTSSVVTGFTLVIMIDAVTALIFKDVGLQ